MKKPATNSQTTGTTELNQVAIQRFQNEIYAYYHAHPRPLPWRETEDPYQILVSEIMLQQTRVERAMGKYQEFLAAFPDLASLAQAPLREVLHVWQGLGYNRRAIALQETAKIVVQDFSGVLPNSADQLRGLPGIGPYTAGAIAAFAFHQPVPIIETNIRTVFIHCFFADRQDVKDSEIMPLVHATLDRDNPREWYYALMDYGVMLKQTHDNPSRKSAHHTRQSRFEGSDRQLRGVILKLLLQKPLSGKEAIFQAIQEDPQRLDKILQGLKKDGFIVRKGTKFTIAG
ncbi:MAG: A/G-specific adenine glycosylase [Deltaproteobacteria bacterium]|nr:A/G-specific adenine glycosylase [Deltaproteobacteria bacterium]TLN05221.1 MAG: A/G-specific adenine glycosylase [bacterium]